MDSIVGSWKFTSGTKEDEIATAMGVPPEVQETMKGNRPTIAYSLDGNILSCKMVTAIFQKETKCVVGTPLEETQADGQCTTITVDFADGQWTETHCFANGSSLRQQKTIEGATMSVQVTFEKDGTKIEGQAFYARL